MKCPECKIELDQRNIGDVTVDECSRCRGIWYDKNELDAVKDEIDPDLSWMDFRIWPEKPDFRVSEQPIDCPSCAGVTMQRITYRGPDVDVLFCPACEGTWLNPGDLTKIVAALEKEADSKSAPDYVRQSLREASDLLTRPQDLVTEWRDLRSVLRLLSYRIFVENPKLKSILVGIQKSLPL